MGFDYNLIQKKCIKWYDNIAPSVSPFSKLSKTEVDYRTYLSGLVGNNAKFKQYELVFIRGSRFFSPENIFFIATPLFEPLNNRNDKNSLRLGKWFYQGCIVEIHGQNVQCKLISPSLVPESELEHILSPEQNK
jgi:hypothetical protein